MPYIDLEDIYINASEREKRELAQWLVEDGYLAEPTQAQSLLQENFYEYLRHIKNCYHQISEEDFDTILKISKKYLINSKLS
jgi:hypothetical protein